jgi:thioredoxin-disulfide reductase
MIYDLVIIGGGPAGITAGIYASRKKMKVLLVTYDFVGQVGKSFLIKNYPGFDNVMGLELSQRLQKQLQGLDVEIKEGEKVIGVEKQGDVFLVKTEKGNSFSGKTVIVATGRKPKRLDTPGEKEFENKGVTYCTTCDGPLFRNKTVAIIGGGNSGFESALELSSYCPRVYVLELSSRIIADEVLQEQARKRDNIEIIVNAKVKEIKGEKFVQSLVYEDLERGGEREIEVQGIFVQIGFVPIIDFVKDLVEINEQGEIVVDPHTCQTKVPGLYAAGDVTDIRFKQIITAAGQGCVAALSSYKYLQRQG